VNNLKLTCDGRLTFWDTPLITHKSPKAPSPDESPEMGLFRRLPPEGKERFLSGLGSSHVLNSENVHADTKKRAVRGSRGITSKGRSIVRQAAAVLEQRYGLKHLSFLTCTLPANALIAYTRDSWARIVEKFSKTLRYHLQKSGLPPLLLVVTEIQEQRFRAYRLKPPVHLHCLFVGRLPSRGWAFPPDFFQDKWSECVEREWATHSVWSASTRVESLRSSSVNYLGKYMSKGLKQLPNIDPALIPSSWYSVSSDLRKICKKLEVRISGYAVHSVYEYFYSSKEFLWCREVMSEIFESGHCYLMAWICQLKGHGAWLELWESLRASQNRLAA